MPFVLLLGLWILGRLAVAVALGLNPLPVLLIDSSFLAVVFAPIFTEVIAARNSSYRS